MYSAHRPTAVSQSALALALLQGKYARLTLPQSEDSVALVQETLGQQM